MGQAKSHPLSNPVIGSQFTVPYPIEITVDTKSSGKFVVTDSENKIMLKVKPCNTTFHHQRLLLTADGRPILMLREKVILGFLFQELILYCS